LAAIAIPLMLLVWTVFVAILYVLMRMPGTLATRMTRLKVSLLLLAIWAVGEVVLFIPYSSPSLVVDWIPIIVQAPFLFLVLSASDIVYQYHQTRSDLKRSGT